MLATAAPALDPVGGGGTPGVVSTASGSHTVAPSADGPPLLLPVPGRGRCLIPSKGWGQRDGLRPARQDDGQTDG